MTRRALPPAVPAGVPLRQPPHPGRFLDRHFLQPLGLNQTTAAAYLGVSRRRIHELVSGEREMTPDTAMRCAVAFGTSADFWLQLQAQWDLWQAWRLWRRDARAGREVWPDAGKRPNPGPVTAKAQAAMRQLRHSLPVAQISVPSDVSSLMPAGRSDFSLQSVWRPAEAGQA